MRSATLPIAVTCPDWCTRTAQQHLDELDDAESCIHLSSDIEVRDTTSGPGRDCIERRPAPSVSISLSTETRLDGREKTSPCVWVDDQECSLEQALALADAIRDLVEVYRLAGGRA